nr:MAG TPA: hypothetical protein [Caudoviricetes sp.]DAU00901.1 MAG TPA: hypothetical protein [Caudoviricetes sp.]
MSFQFSTSLSFRECYISHFLHLLFPISNNFIDQCLFFFCISQFFSCFSYRFCIFFIRFRCIDNNP